MRGKSGDGRDQWAFRKRDGMNISSATRRSREELMGNECFQFHISWCHVKSVGVCSSRDERRWTMLNSRNLPTPTRSRGHNERNSCLSGAKYGRCANSARRRTTCRVLEEVQAQLLQIHGSSIRSNLELGKVWRWNSTRDMG